MKQFIGAAALLICSAFALSAQTPGYLGKRFFLEATGAFSPALSKPTAANRGLGTYGEQGISLGFNSQYSLQAGYAISRSRVLALEANYLSTGMALTAYTPSLLYDGQSDEHYLFYNLSGPGFGVALQTYNPLRGSIAPMGFFSAWRLRMSFLQGEILDKRTSYALGETNSEHLPLGIKPRYKHLTLGFEMGQRMVLLDKIVLTISAEVNITPLSLPFQQSYDSSIPDNQSLFKSAASGRMSFHSLFMFKIGLGYLL